MDLAYNPHAERSRRKNRSSTNINHLTLAPLTTRLPIDNSDGGGPDLDASFSNNNGFASISRAKASSSYLEGRSAPTTPRLLTHSPAGSRSRSHHRTSSTPGAPITKSKSATHLGHVGHNTRKSVGGGGTTTPGRRRDEAVVGPNEVDDSDWLLRTGAMMSSEAREFKGQAWLVSRQSSTSLVGMRDPDEVAFEQELARERDMNNSRRGSSALAADDENSAFSPYASRHPSRPSSRSHSVAGRRRSSQHVRSPGERLGAIVGGGEDSYFQLQGEEKDVQLQQGPDFVNLDEVLEELERGDTLVDDDEAAVRRLVRRGKPGRASWIENVIGWSLFSVEENDEESDDGEDESVSGDTVSQTGRSAWASRHLEGISNVPMERLPPPKADDGGGWQDAAWLLSVATKVMF